MRFMIVGSEVQGSKVDMVSGVRCQVSVGQSDIEECNYYLRLPGGWLNIKDKEIPKLTFRSRIQEPES
jgi:hypothetical protein